MHGAIGYTWECDLQIWMKRAWSLDLAWGSAARHRARVADAVIDGALTGAQLRFRTALIPFTTETQRYGSRRIGTLLVLQTHVSESFLCVLGVSVVKHVL